nr:RNA-directed DNA polymerase, eukaryota, reverse transcriptase zinc-binding domain protein [Tanacetum cinerariifolium]
MLGDFNITIKVEEHSSGGSQITSNMQELIDCANDVKIKDINSTSLFFTWIKSSSKPETSVTKKLDRILDVVGHNMYRVVKKLKAIKQPMKKLNWKNCNLTKKVELYRDKLKATQKDMVKSPYSKSIKAKEAECLVEYLVGLNDEEKILFQKAKVKWISNDDRNTKYFHVASKRNINRIMSVCNEKGERFKEIIEFFSTGKLLDELNATLITLIPKIPQPNKVSDFRPIAYSISVIKAALLEFSNSSGLKPNMEKSVVFFGSVKEVIKKRILEILPFKVGKFLVKYLGIPLLAKKLAVLSTMQTYWASVLLIPKTALKEFDKVLKNFLWGNGFGSNGRSKVA